MKNANYKLLVVDDEPDILEFLSYNLDKEGYQVYTAPNGKVALEKAVSLNPDLIILDIMMPEIDGVEVCRRLRENNDFINTLIIFLTARNEDFSQIAGFEVGADDYITKPIRPRVFLSRIKALLRRQKKIEKKDPILSFDGLTIDRERYLVIKDKEEITLARKEFELLYLLVSKPGKVFTREKIYNKIWGTEVIVGNRTIDVHIRKIREKLGGNFIKTVKGIGYKFEF